MNRWIQFFILGLGVMGFWRILTPPPMTTSPVVKATAPIPKRLPAQASSAPVAKSVTPVVQKKKLQTGSLKLEDYDSPIDTARSAIANGKRNWHFISGLSAVAVNTPGIPTPLDVMSGFAVINSGDVPSGVESFSLVKRDDNGLVGIFTGIIKAVGEKGSTPGLFLSECPQGEIKESYPALKSYLLKAHNSEEKEFFECLSLLQRFKLLEWEILDHPHGHR